MTTDAKAPPYPSAPPTSQPGRKPDREDDENRFYDGVTFASDSYVPWVFGKLRLGKCDTSRMQESGCPVLRNHIPDRLVGAVLTVGKRGGLWRSDWRLPKISGNKDTFDLLDSGVLRGISVGGRLNLDTLVMDNEKYADKLADALFTCDWQIIEESLTGIPADTSATVDRMLAGVLQRDSPAVFDTLISPEGIFTKATPDIQRQVEALFRDHNETISLRKEQAMTTQTEIPPDVLQRAVNEALATEKAQTRITDLEAQVAKLTTEAEAEAARNMEARSEFKKIQFQPQGRVLQLDTWNPRDNAIDLGKILRLTCTDDVGFPPLDRANTSLEESILERVDLEAPGRNTVGRIPFEAIIEQQKQLHIQRNTLAGGAGARPVDINVLGDGGLLLSAFSPILGSMTVRTGLSGGQKLPYWTAQGTAAGGAEGADITIGTWTLEDSELLPVSIATAFEISSSLRAADDGAFEGLVRMGVQGVAGEELVKQVLDGGGSTANEISGLWSKVSTATPDRLHEYGSAQTDFARSDVLTVKNFVALAKSDGSAGSFILSTSLWQLCEGTLRGGDASDRYLLESMGGMMQMDGGMAMVGEMEGRPTYFFQDFAPSGVTDAGLMIKPDRVTVFLWGNSFDLEYVPIMARKEQYKLIVEANIGVIQPDANLAAIRQT